ncbi:hypothetical protein [Salinispora tropica]|uniref:hypothetical protein n=1 Tax=Salinispora tropica TaxID=168695 RepID=UPI000ACACF31|nr:hypothetical protein [Salinispora tropica]
MVSPDPAEQGIGELLTVYDALIDHAVTAAVDLSIDPDEISYRCFAHGPRPT